MKVVSQHRIVGVVGCQGDVEASGQQEGACHAQEVQDTRGGTTDVYFSASGDDCQTVRVGNGDC